MKKYERFQLDKCPKPLQRKILESLGTNWEPKHYHTDPKCKICRSPIRADIEELLYAGVSYQDIESWMKRVGEPSIPPSAISKHYKEHCNIYKETQERGVVNFVSNVRKREAAGLAKLSNAEVLEGIVEWFVLNFNPEEEKIKPETVIKAIKVQHEISGENAGRDPILRLYETLADKNLRMTVEPAGPQEEVIDGDVVEDEGQEQARPALLSGTGD